MANQKKPKRPARRSRRSTRQPFRVALLLHVLVHIATHGGVAEPEIREITKKSRASNKRLLGYARRHFGVAVVWRHDHSLPHTGEYSLEDWGVFDAVRAVAWVRRKATS